MPLYTIGDAYVLRSRVLEALELAAVSRDPDLRRELLTFVFCGGGFSGIEGAAAIEDLVHEALRYYPSIEPGEPRFILAPHGDRLLEQIDEKLGDYVLKRFERRDVDVRLGVGVTNVTARSATLSTGEVVPTRTVMWAAGIEASPLLREIDLPLDEHGAVRVGRDLQVQGLDNVFALGDCAAVPDATGSFYAPTAQNAAREGPVGGEEHPRHHGRRAAEPYVRLQTYRKPCESRSSRGRGPDRKRPGVRPSRLAHVAGHLPRQAAAVLTQGAGRARLDRRSVQPGRDRLLADRAVHRVPIQVTVGAAPQSQWNGGGAAGGRPAAISRGSTTCAVRRPRAPAAARSGSP